MEDKHVAKLAQVLVDYSAEIKPGDRVAIEATIAAEALVRALYETILERGGIPYLLLDLPDQNEIFFRLANDNQLDAVPAFRKMAYEKFESRIRIHSDMNPNSLSKVDPARQQRRQKALASILETQMRRGADRSFKWVSTLFPTPGYAKEAGMSLKEFEEFVFHACHADQEDPVKYWNEVQRKQEKIVERFKGHDKVLLHGPNVDLSLSIKGRTFLNASGKCNMPDGEIFSGPMEETVNGTVRFTFPAIYSGVLVEGVELTFKEGKVIKASATNNEAFLLEMLDSDRGARYVGEFAIGTNYEINRFSHNILFDEKMGGSFHMALGAGYPETGSRNKSIIHWDMICGLDHDSEILLDGEIIYKNGGFTF